MNDYDIIERAIDYIATNFRDQPDLKTLAGAVGLSEYHFQRVFTRWAGISPKRVIQYLTAEYARDLLQTSRGVVEAAYDAGLSSPGRLHDLTVNIHAMTPGEVARFGAGLTVRYGVHDSPFGAVLLAASERGLVAARFLSDRENDPLAATRAEWPAARFVEDPAATAEVRDRVFSFEPPRDDTPLAVLVRGTNFQVRVWEALLRIPTGAVTTYGDIARRIGRPNASRAVGSAVGRNPLAYVIPCHRVIRSSGQFGDYQWGRTRKQAMLAWEAAQFQPESTQEVM